MSATVELIFRTFNLNERIIILFSSADGEGGPFGNEVYKLVIYNFDIIRNMRLKSVSKIFLINYTD